LKTGSGEKKKVGEKNMSDGEGGGVGKPSGEGERH